MKIFKDIYKLIFKKFKKRKMKKNKIQLQILRFILKDIEII
jgi:hypothetical protein